MDSVGYGQHARAVARYRHAHELYVGLRDRQGEADTLPASAAPTTPLATPRRPNRKAAGADRLDEPDHPDADQPRTKLATPDGRQI